MDSVMTEKQCPRPDSQQALLNDSRRHSSICNNVEENYIRDVAIKIVPELAAQSDTLDVNQSSVAILNHEGIPHEADRNAAMSLETRKYWSSQLGGASVSNFPPKQTTRPSVHAEASFDRQLHIPNHNGTTISAPTLLRGAWALVLARYVDSTDVVFGTNASEILLSVPGASSSTAPLRVWIIKDDTTAEFLTKLQQQINRMLYHAHIGLESIRELGGVISEVCDFQSRLIIQASEDTEESMRSFRQDIGTCPLEVKCTIKKNGGSKVRFIFDTGRISTRQAHTVCDQFEHVVTQLITRKTCVISDINICGPRDVKQIEHWSRQNLPRQVRACVQDLISEQALRDPDHEAILACDGSFTYAELDVQSNKLASHLASLEVRREVMVAMCFEKSKWAIVAMLAILKAGGAFVSLDPAHPSTRHRVLLDRVNAKIIITSPEVAPSCSGMVEHTIVLPADHISQTQRVHFGSDGHANIEPGLGLVGSSPDSAAYVIFTSGSTGNPKGMVVEQAALSSSIIGHGAAYGLRPASRVLQFSNFTFDSCLSEILTPLVFGATVCMPSDAQRLQDVGRFMRDAEVNMAILTPTFAATLKPEEVPTLKTLILSGEKISRAQLETWCNKVELINAYGPSEVCVDCMLHVVSACDSPNKIGLPHNATCWIVDPDNHDQLAPIGCPGELLVQAPGLARGYLDDEMQTKASFLSTDQCSWLPVSVVGEGRPFRLYKTGDLVRYTYDHDGSMEYIGRKDTQVKLRGQRLELGEIEYNIRNALAHVKLEHIVVELVAQASHDVLVGFIAFPGSSSPTTSPASAPAFALSNTGGQEIKDMLLAIDEKMHDTLARLIDYLEAALPLFMIPRLFLPLQAMPFTSSMKIDRKSLRMWASSMSVAELADYSIASTDRRGRQNVDSGLVMKQEREGQGEGERGRGLPMTEMELRIRDLWAEVLKIEAGVIGKNDNFLQMGGDSISTIKLVSRARNAGITLSVMSIFQDGRLSRLADAAIAAAAAVAKGAEASWNLGSTSTSILLDASTSNTTDSIQTAVAPFTLLPLSLSDLNQAREQCHLSSNQILGDMYPCTPLQENLMELSTQHPTSNIVRYVYRLDAKVNIARFKYAWRETVLRCVNLRTRIVLLQDGRMAQVVVEDVPDSGDAWDFDRYADISPPFDLAKEKRQDLSMDVSMGYGSRLFRYALVHKEDGDFEFIWIMHYNILDPWSGDLMRQTLESAYHGYNVGPKLQPFNRFIKYIIDLDRDDCQAYWTAQLQGAQRTVFPPCSVKLEHENTRRSATHSKSEFCRLLPRPIPWPTVSASSITRATVLRAAWALMLARYCKTEDVCFGTNISGRNAIIPGLDTMVGLMPATVPVRVRFERGRTAFAWLQEIQDQSAQITAYEQYGLHNISELNHEARAACNFTSLMIIQPANLLDSAAASDSVLISSTDERGIYFNYPLLKGYFTQPLFVQLLVHEDRVDFDAVYDPCVMVESQVIELSDHFVCAFRHLCAADETTLMGHMLSSQDGDL